jgi:hypothetical protein
MLKMKKTLKMSLVCLLALATTGVFAKDQEPVKNSKPAIGTSVIGNGDFSVIVDKPKGNKGIDGEKFPQRWNGNMVKLIPGKDNKNQIELKDCLYTYMSVPVSEKSNAVNGEIAVSGKGKLTIWVSTCIRKPDDKRGFGHELKHEIGTFDLTENQVTLPFTFELAPYENGYIYFRVAGNALIDCISASATQK